MKRATVAAISLPLGCLVVASLTYAAVASSAWVFAVLPVMPAALLASLGLGATLLTRARSSRPHGLITLGALLAVAGASSTLAYFALWQLQFDYVDAGREVPAALTRWDQITFVGSAGTCMLSIILALAVLARAWSKPSGVRAASPQVEGPDTTLPVVRY